MQPLPAGMDAHDYTNASSGLGATLVSAVVVFTVTNIDDLLILALFFADPQLRTRAILLGQLVGIGTLVLASVLAGWAAFAVPERWVALLGLVPLALGLMKAYALWSKRADGEHDAQPVSPSRSSLVREVLAVASVTIANGGDNLGVYIPLFAAKRQSILLYTIVFAVMTALFCALGAALVRQPVMGAKLRRYGHIALPSVLIAIGLELLRHAF